MSDVTLSISVTLTRRQYEELMRNSVERVINTSVRIAQEHSDPDQDLADINLRDWEGVGPVVRKLWEVAREAGHPTKLK